MERIIASAMLIFTLFGAGGQNLYIRTFGESRDHPVIFLHGGPGYNSANFEATTAQKLADHGFFVVVYDRRGEGRSHDEEAQFTFSESFDDLLAIYQEHNLSRATLIGHSFGGVLATLFAAAYPEKIRSVVLVSVPVSLQETFRTIISSSKAIYEAKKDSLNLNYIRILESMDSSSIQYSSYCFMHAMQNGFYTPENLSEEASKIYARFSTDSLLLNYANQMTYQPTQGFWENERYTTLDIEKPLTQLSAKGVAVYALYGKDDGLFANNQVERLRRILGDDQLQYLENCAHNVFIDQQSLFLNTLKSWLK